MDALPHLHCAQVASPTVHQPAPTAPSSFTFSCSNHSSAELRARGTFRFACRALATQSIPCRRPSRNSSLQAQPRPAGRALLGLGWNAAPSFSNNVSSDAVSRRHVFVAAAMLLVVGQPLVVVRACWGLSQTCLQPDFGAPCFMDATASFPLRAGRFSNGAPACSHCSLLLRLVRQQSLISRAARKGAFRVEPTSLAGGPPATTQSVPLQPSGAAQASRQSTPRPGMEYCALFL